MSKKKWIIGLTFFLFLSVGFCIFRYTGVVSKSFNFLLSPYLEKTFKREVFVGKINSNFFNKIILSDVIISNPDTFKDGIFLKSRKIVLYYNIWHIFKKKEKFNLRKIVFFSPHLFISEKNTKVNENDEFLFNIQDFSFALLPREVIIKSGKLYVKERNDTGKYFSFQDVSGKISLDKGKTFKTDFSFRRRSDLAEKIKLAGTIDLDAQLFNLKFDVKSLDFNYYTKFFAWYERIKFIKGLVDLKCSIKGEVPFKKEILKQLIFDGTAEFREGEIKSDKYPYDLSHINGKCVFNNKEVAVSSLTLDIGDSRVSFSGNIKDPLFVPFFEFKVVSNSLDLSLCDNIFANVGHLSKIKLFGRGNMELNVKGAMDDLMFSGAINGKENKLNDVAIEDFKIDFKYKKNIINVSDVFFRIGDGKISANGLVDLNKTAAYKKDKEFFLYARSLDIEVLNKIFGLKNIKGLSNVYFKMKGTIFDPQIQGNINCSNLQIGKEKLKLLTLNFNYLNKKLQINGENDDNHYTFLGEIKITDDKIKVNKFNLSISDKGQISIVGYVFQKEPREINFAINAGNINFKEVPYLKKYSDKFGGMFNFKGFIRGNLNNPLLDIELFNSNVTVDKNILDFDAKMSLNKDFLTIPFFKLNGYSGSLKLDFNEERTCNAKLIVDNAEVNMLLALINSPYLDKDNQGKLKGKITLDGPIRNIEKLKAEVNLEISPTLKINKVTLNDIRIGFIIKEQMLKINNFYAGQQQGNISMSGSVGLNKNIENEVKFLGSFVNFKLGDFKLDGNINGLGDVSFKSGLTVKGKLESLNLKVNNKNFKKISSVVFYKDKVFAINSLKFDKEYTGNLKFDFSEEPLLDGALFVDVGEIASVFALLPDKIRSVPTLNGKVKGKVLFSGLLSNPKIEANLNILGGEYKGAKFDCLSAFFFHDKVLDIKPTSVKLQNQGEVDIFGNIYLKGKVKDDDREQLNITFGLKKIDLSILESFLAGEQKIKLKGTLDGELKLNGMFSLPVLSGNISSKDNSVNLFEIKKVDSKFILENKKIVFSLFSAKRQEGEVELLDGSFLDFSDMRSWQFQIKPILKNINFAKVSFFGGFNGKGYIRLNNNLEIGCNIDTKNFWVNQYNFENEKLDVSFKDSRLKFVSIDKKNKHLSGDIKLVDKSMLVFNQLELYQGQKSDNKIFSLSGNLDLKGNKTDILVQGLNEGVDAGDFAGLFNIIHPQISGQSRFTLRMRGDLENPIFSCDMDVEKGGLGNLKFDSLKVSLYTKGKMLILNQLDIVKNNEYSVNGSGEIPFIFGKTKREELKDEKININLSLVQGQGGLAILKSLSKVVKKANGDISGKLQIKGTLSKPDIKGFLKVNDGEIYANNVMRRIKNFDVDIELVNNYIEIKKIYGEVGKGNINIWGRIFLKEFLGVDNFDIYLETSKQRGIPIFLTDVSIPQSAFFDRLFPNLASSGEAKISAHIYGNTLQYYINGIAELFDTHFTYPPLPTKKIWEAANNSEGKGWTFLNQAVWDFQINTGENVWYENEVVNVNIKGGLRLQEGTEEIKVSGKIEAIKGEVNYLGTSFTIKKADVEFQDGVGYLEGEAETKVQRLESRFKNDSWVEDVIVMIFEKGKIGEVTPKFVSKNYPNTDQEQAMRLAITGVDISSMDPQSKENLLKREVVRLVDATLASPLIKNVLRRTGLIDVVKVTRKEEIQQQEVDSAAYQDKSNVPDVLKGATITLGKYLSDRFFLGYSMGLHDKLQDKLALRQEIEMSYRVKQRFYLKGLLGLNSEDEKKIFIEHQWRFGWEQEKEDNK